MALILLQDVFERVYVLICVGIPDGRDRGIAETRVILLNLFDKTFYLQLYDGSDRRRLPTNRLFVLYFLKPKRVSM
ncbi:MAG: hypothetical protein ACREVO_08855 [Steroidobacteraceae bacterium]